jgi:hypothetical protein
VLPSWLNAYSLKKVFYPGDTFFLDAHMMDFQRLGDDAFQA